MTEPLLLGAARARRGADLTRRLRRRFAAGSPGGSFVLALACLTRYEAWPITAAAIACAFASGAAGGAATVRAATADGRARRRLSGRGDPLVLRAQQATVGAVVRHRRVLRAPTRCTRAGRSSRWAPSGGACAVSAPRRWRASALASALALVVLWWRRLVPNAPLLVTLALARRRRPCRCTRSTKGTRSASATWCRSVDACRGRLRAGARPAAAPLATAAPPRSLLVGVIVARAPFRRRRRADGARGAVGSSRTASRGARSPAAFRDRGDGDVIMASMGSLAHYMQELSADGFASARLPARRQRRPVAAALERPAPSRRLDADRGEGRRRRHAGRNAREHPRSSRLHGACARAAGRALHERYS